jgi:diacylglycerol kinase (ATP)
MKEEIIIEKEDVIKETRPIEKSEKKTDINTEIEIVDLNNNMNLNMNMNMKMKINQQPDTYYLCFIKRFTNLKYGLTGLYYLSVDKSILMQFFFASVLITAGIIQKFTIIQWILQLILITINIGCECCNTIVELIANFVEPNFNKKIGLIKDISAGMVILTMLITITASVLIHFI